jgi:hypothetical protein
MLGRVLVLICCLFCNWFEELAQAADHPAKGHVARDTKHISQSSLVNSLNGEIVSGPLDDQGLRTWLQRHADSILVIVSPGMPYSTRFLPVVEAEAAKKKLPIRVVKDQELSAVELLKRGAMRHYPTLFFVRSHRLYPKVFPGAQTAKELRFYLDEIFR